MELNGIHLASVKFVSLTSTAIAAAGPPTTEAVIKFVFTKRFVKAKITFAASVIGVSVLDALKKPMSDCKKVKVKLVWPFVP